jgi:DMSO/TMAO reductase YedYZ molybdopterin-dependent catalytic subunit
MYRGEGSYEMNETNKPGILTGALVGLMLTLPVIALLYLADQLAGLPFVPFDVFDFVGQRILSGEIITTGIDAIVRTIRTLGLGETSSTAKVIEHILAISGFVVTGVVAGAVLFYILNRRETHRRDYTPGLILGAVVGIPIMLISNSINLTATAAPAIGALWIVIVFLVWGAAYSWIYNDLRIVPVKSESSGEAESGVSVIDRRQFLVRIGGVTATLTVIGAGLGALLGQSQSSRTVSIAENVDAEIAASGSPDSQIPNANAVVQPAPGTRPEITPLDKHYRIDISSRPPVIDGETWKLKIGGLVENPVELTLNDLVSNYEPLNQYITLACISNPVGGDLTSTLRWTGVSLQKILDEIKPTGTHLRIVGADGFDEVLDLEVARQDERVMLTYAWDGQPLKEKHGFPLRIYIPDHYGMKQPKWITGMEVIDHWEEGYWVRRGWSAEARMNATSVIDTVAVESAMQDGDQLLIPIGGIAHAGARGISKVEVSVDDGDWVEAQLRDPVSPTTWVIWRYDWPFEAGDHTFAVRCYEGDGTPQVASSRGVRPDGATGIDTVRESLDAPASTT